ncbi:MAG TPA: FkbM family methyltransferase [Cyclobacteriaceae bacterium]|nr:FkbM family methyltransferase [Cyclobacteriaceae bacterium]
MDLIEKLKFHYRALRYKNKNDVGGIHYLINNIKAGDTVLDIGAHKGGYLYFMLKRTGGTGKVFAFEPQSNLFQYLNQLSKIYKWKNVIIEQLALSDVKSETTLFVPGHKKGNFSSPGATIASEKIIEELSHTEKVNTDTLDNYCSKHQIIPAFLKIDVEGNELRIFKGGINTLRNSKPKIIVEIEDRHVGKNGVTNTINFLTDLGYTCKFIHGNTYRPLNEFDFEKHQNLGDMKNYCNNFIFE